MTAPIEAWEAAEVARLQDEIATAQARYRILEEVLQKAQSAAARAQPEERPALIEEATKVARELAGMHVPVPPRLIADDISPERLATLLHDQGGRMAVMSPEGDVFDLMAGRYSKNGAPNFGVYLKGHAGDTIRVDRVGRPPEFVRRPALTMGLAIQPEVLRGLTDKPGFRGRGLLGRFLYAMPKSLLGSRDTNAPVMPQAIRAAYSERVKALLELPFATDEQGHPAPHILQLSPEARQHLQAFAVWLEPQLAEFGELGHMTDWAGKLVGAAVRIMGLLHMAEHAGEQAPWGHQIHTDTAERAIRMATYLIPHARAAYAAMGAHPVMDDACYVLAWIKRHGADGLTKREIFEGT